MNIEITKPELDVLIVAITGTLGTVESELRSNKVVMQNRDIMESTYISLSSLKARLIAYNELDSIRDSAISKFFEENAKKPVMPEPEIIGINPIQYTTKQNLPIDKSQAIEQDLENETEMEPRNITEKVGSIKTN